MRAKKGTKALRNLFDLKGKVALVTGGSGALGRAVSLGLAAYGVDVALCSIDKEGLEDVSREIQKMGRKALPMFCDVTDPEQVDKTVDRSLEKFGKIHVLFNGAGIAHREPLVDLAVEEWQRVMDVNVKGTLLPCRAVAKKNDQTGAKGKHDPGGFAPGVSCP